jgi:hypothetical protein
VSDLFSDANDFVEDMRRAYAVQSVTYRRGTYCLTIDATLTKTTVEAIGVDETAVRTRIADAIFAKTELVDATGRFMPPEPDDEISITLEGVAHTYRPRIIASDKACWQYGDTYHRTIRVHLLSVGKE